MMSSYSSCSERLNYIRIATISKIKLVIRCREGYSISADGMSCSDTDECVWSPCFHGGQCVNTDTGINNINVVIIFANY